MSSLRTLFRPVVASAVASRTFSTTARSQYAKIAVIGRLAAQPELKASSTGKNFIKYTLITNHGASDSGRTSGWFVTSFPSSDGQRDYILNLPKGALVHVEADAEMAKYADEEAGKTRSSLNLVQRNIEVLARPKAATEVEESEGAAASG